MHANERWVKPSVARSGAAGNCGGWLGYPEPFHLFVEHCRTWIFWGGETDSSRVLGTAELAFWYPLNQRRSKLCQCIVYLFFFFQSFWEPGTEITESALVRLTSLLTQKNEILLWFVKFNQSTWKLVLPITPVALFPLLTRFDTPVHVKCTSVSRHYVWVI